jgi:transposase
MNTRHAVVGLDLGKTSIFVGFLPESPTAAAPKNWRSVVQVSYADPRWWVTLLDLIDENAVVAAEPTGHHLLAPVANLLHAYRPSAALWHVEGRTSAAVREQRVAAAKNDRLDAIALTLIAADIAAGNPPRGCRPYNHFLESAVQRLRMLVNTHRRLVKETARTKNRLDVLAFGLWPSFAGSATWARAVRHGAITPAQIKALAAQQPPPEAYTDGRARRPLLTLAADLPEVDSDPATVAAINAELDRQRVTDQQLAQVEAQIRAVINHPPFRTVTERWRTIPNAGDLYIAALHVTTLGRAGEFDRDDFAAACGVTPRTNSSGGIDRTRASRSGYVPTRVALHMWALSLLSPNAAPNPIKTARANGSQMPACKNKLARVLWGVARSPDGYKYQPPGQPSSAAEEAGEYPPAE